MKLTRAQAVAATATLLVVAVGAVYFSDRADAPFESATTRLPQDAQAQSSAGARVFGSGERSSVGGDDQSSTAQPVGVSTARTIELAACLEIVREEEFRACIESIPHTARPAEAAAAVCGADLRSSRRALVCLAVLLRRVPGEALCEWVNDFAEFCPNLAYPGDFVHRAMRLAAESDPSWLVTVVASMDTTWVYGVSAGNTWVRIAGLLATEGDATARAIIDAGALGQCKINRTQMDEAIVFATACRAAPETRLEFLRTIVDAPGLEQNPDAVGAAVLRLLQPESWPASDSIPALTIVLDCLYKERLAEATAAQVLENHQEKPSAGMDAHAWSLVWAKATDVGIANHWVINGVQY